MSDDRILAALRPVAAETIEAALRPTFYVDAQLIRGAVSHRSCFNLLYLPVYFKVDVFVCKDSPC
ncbi:MAG: hypothetical protein ABIP94_17175 [Planctomycetota bacterium]